MPDKTALQTPFKPSLSKSETKAEITDRTARSIIEAEARERGVKTAKLRKVRLAKATNQSAHDT